jgi:hypothetical protein
VIPLFYNSFNISKGTKDDVHCLLAGRERGGVNKTKNNKRKIEEKEAGEESEKGGKKEKKNDPGVENMIFFTFFLNLSSAFARIRSSALTTCASPNASAPPSQGNFLRPVWTTRA